MVAETYLEGPGRWAMPAAGDPKAPLAVLDVPAGYQGKEDYVWTHDELDLKENQGQILYRAPTRVLNDPCDTDGPSPRLGPTVEDLAEALVAQKRTTTTQPLPATLGGYRGLYLELSPSEGAKACGPDGEMVLWEAGDEGRVFEYPATDGTGSSTSKADASSSPPRLRSAPAASP
ncbi:MULTISPECIES: hypothetical protein [unclassified Knoellia]|uniref:hypothetical protein n=1 Tax=Knoellia altitudinis TaxID=3404795 RepID=UPI00361D623A